MTTDANELEAMAKEHPNACFLKGSGVLKLIGAIRTLEAELAALKAQPAPTEVPNFCATYGKRLHAGSIHTCTPPGGAQVSANVSAMSVQPLCNSAAQGEDSARLSIPVSAYLWLMGAGGDAFAQPLRSGSFWWRDTFNKLAGVDMMEIIRQDRARASAETGGVKS